MTVAETCLLVALMMPYVAVGLAKADPHYDNAQPRAWLATRSGWRARAVALQANCFEALPLFVAAVLVAEFHHLAQATTNGLAVLFVLLRLGYALAYLANRPTSRSVLWTLAAATAVGLLVAGGLSPN